MTQLKKIVLIGALLLTSASAFALPEKPTQCPGVGRIKAVGLQQITTPDTGSGLLGTATDHYGTPQNWEFSVWSLPYYYYYYTQSV